MKNSLTDRKRKILRRIYGALSFSTALFVFQACYGTPDDYYFRNTLIEGKVSSAVTDLPIEGIRITVENQPWVEELTNPDGQFGVYVEFATEIRLKFEDIDSIQRGEFLPLDTLIHVKTDPVSINIKLDAR
ncbi:MAG: hypothetical protein U0T82_10830 [Bacteroidales bacterium]